LELVVLK